MTAWEAAKVAPARSRAAGRYGDSRWRIALGLKDRPGQLLSGAGFRLCNRQYKEFGCNLMAFQLNMEDDSLFDLERDVKIHIENGAFNHRTYRVTHGNKVARFSILSFSREPTEQEKLDYPWIRHVAIYNVLGSDPLFPDWTVAASHRLIADALTFLENNPYNPRERPVDVFFDDPRYMDSLD